MKFIAKYLLYPPAAVCLWLVFVVCMAWAVIENSRNKITGGLS